MYSYTREEQTMQIMKKIKLAVVAVLMIGTMARETEVQARGIDIFLPPLPSVVFSHNDRDYHHDEYRPRHHSSRVCWEEVVQVERRHGRYRNEVRTVCRDRGWRGHHDSGWRNEYRGRDRW